MNNLTVSANYSIINSRYIDSFSYGGPQFVKGDRAPSQPTYTAGASIAYSFPKVFGTADKLSMSLALTSQGKAPGIDYYQYWLDLAALSAVDYNNYVQPDFKNITTPANTRYHLSMEYQFHKNLAFYVRAENFTNNTTPDFDRSRPVPGSSWLFGLKMNFNKLNK